MSVTQHKKDIIYKKLKEEILLGKITVNTKFPKELDFAKELGVGKITLRSALARLEKDGLIARIPAKGTFVIDRTKQKTEDMKILVIGTPANDLEAPNNYIIPGVEATAAKFGYETTMCDLDFFKSISLEDLKNSLVTNNIMGIILVGMNYFGEEPYIQKLKQIGLPVVLPHASAGDAERTGFAAIRILQDKAWIDALRHLHEQGHKRVGTLILKGKEARGFSKTEHLTLLKAYDMAADKELIGEAEYDPDSIANVVEQWLQLPERPTAILCYSDFIALKVYGVLKKNNIQIPNDIAVMGYCGYPGGSFLAPALSTIDFEYNKLGQKSVELLVKSNEWFNKKGVTPPQVIKEHKLIVRGSTNLQRSEKQFI